MRGGGGIQNFRFSRCKTFQRDENRPCEEGFFEKCIDRQISCELDNRKRSERIKGVVQATLQCFYSVSQLSIKLYVCAHHVMINLGLLLPLRILSILLSLVSDSNASGGGGARGFFAHQLSKLHTNQYTLECIMHLTEAAK